MSFFAAFSIVWGTIMIGLRLFMHLIPKAWSEFELNQVYTEKKPRWVWGLGLLSILIVALTWYKEITTDVPYSLFLTILVSLTLIKIFQLVFNYTHFREFVKRALVEDRKILRKINLATTIIGTILIFLGIFIF